MLKKAISEKLKKATVEALASTETPPIIPSRLRSAIFHVVDDVMPEEWAGAMGDWLFQQRTKMNRCGDEDGRHAYFYGIRGIDESTVDPELMGGFRKVLLSKLSDALPEICVPDFDLTDLECNASLFHHGHHCSWHDGVTSHDGSIATTRRVSFSYFMHSPEKMFSGGEMEFMDGSKIEPKHNQLVFWHPIQQTRILPVECWSAHVLHGRWELHGWLHGNPPDGWVDKLTKLRDS